MRVAFAGSHRTGKTTLVEAVAARVSRYAVFEEPYRVLEDEGHEFSDPPSVEDFEHQLRHMLDTLATAPPHALFDRSPLDLVAYLQAIDEDYEMDGWLDAVREGMEPIDLLVFVPIEAPDRIAVPAHEDRRLRQRVDELLRASVLEDGFGHAIETIEVSGSVEERVRAVVQAMRA